MKDLGKITVAVTQTQVTKQARAKLSPEEREQRTHERGARKSINEKLRSLRSIGKFSSGMTQVGEFAKSPSLGGAKDLLSGSVGKSLKTGSLARFAPMIARSIVAIGAIGAVFAAVAIVVAAVVVAFKKFKAMLESFVSDVSEYSGSMSSAKALAENRTIMTKIRAGMGMSGQAGASFIKANTRYEDAIIRLQASLAPLGAVFVNGILDMMSDILEYVAGLFEVVNAHWGQVQSGVGMAGQAAGIASYATGSPIMGKALMDAGSSLREISKNTKNTAKNTEKPIDWTEANQGFIADLTLMGVDPSYSKSRLP